MREWCLIRTEKQFVIATSYEIIAKGTYERMKKLYDKLNKCNEGLVNPSYYYVIREITFKPVKFK